MKCVNGVLETIRIYCESDLKTAKSLTSAPFGGLWDGVKAQLEKCRQHVERFSKLLNCVQRSGSQNDGSQGDGTQRKSSNFWTKGVRHIKLSMQASEIQAVKSDI